jgi:hypothetical protein
MLRRRAVASVLAVIGALTACGGGPGVEAAQGSTSPSPFELTVVPHGFRLEAAGAGTDVQDWGSDEGGTEEPVTVLAPPGQDARGPGAVVVSATGFSGQQGGLDQSAAGYPTRDVRPLQVDGRRALFTPPGGGQNPSPWADLVVMKGPESRDVAVRVRARTLSRDEMVAIARAAVVPRDHELAPVVHDPPKGLAVVGSATAQVQAAVWAYAMPHSDAIPGLASTRSLAWSQGGSGIAALTLAGAPNDLSAVPAVALSGFDEARIAAVDVRGTAGLSVELGDRRRAVLVPTSWGDLLVVVATGAHAPPTSALVAMAASARQVDGARWAHLHVAAEGGPGLHPDPGAVELARGTVHGIEWLLQARPQRVRWPDQVHRTSLMPDECLKLSTLHRACAPAGATGTTERINTPFNGGDLLPDGFPPFVFVATSRDAVRVRIEQGDQVGESEIHRPGPGQIGGAVVFGFVDVSIWSPVCGSGPTSLARHTARVELLDAAGQRIRCLGA